MTTIQDVALRLIDIDDNVRVDPGELHELALSIGELGVLQPVKVIPNGVGRFSLVFGQRRVLAAREAGLTTIPAMVAAPDAGLGRHGARRAAEQLTENLQRSALNPMEEAVAIRAVLDANKALTQAAFSQQLGRSGFWVSRRLALLELHPHVQKLLRESRINDAVASALIPLPVGQQARMVGHAARFGWSAKETDRRVHLAPHPRRKQARGRPRIYEVEPATERSRSVVVPIRNPGSRGQVTIGIDAGLVDLIVEDSAGHRVMLTLRADDAKLLGRRLTQAWQAVAS